MLFLIIVIALSSQLWAAGNVSAQDEYDTLRLRWKLVLTGDGYSASDPDVVNRAALISAEAKGYWDSMNKSAGRTALWSDLASATNSAHITGSYNRIRSMVVAYATEGSSLYNNASFLADIISAMDWLHANRYHAGKTMYGNWWDWEIGTPLALNDSVAILYEKLSPTQINNYMSAIEKFQPTIVQTGANRVWESLIIAVRGVIVKDSAKIALARDGLSPVFDYVVTGDGFYKDGSFIQHEAFPYNGGYGKELLSDVSRMLFLLDKSSWAITDPDKQNVYRWVYDSFEPFVYKGAMMDMVRGRDVSREFSDHFVGHSVIRSLILLAQVAPPVDADQYKSMIKGWILSDTYENFYANSTIYMIKQAKNIVNDSAIPIRGELIKHLNFSRMDRVLHLRPGFAFGLSQSSNRILNYESINSENFKGWYTADGMTYLYNADLAQYSDGYWPTVNPYRLPGTTIDTQVRANSSGSSYRSTSSWVGGASIQGLYGISGMELDAFGSTLTARKSWFMFDDEIVALGAGISSTDNRTIETTIDNRKLNAAGNNVLTINGESKPTTLGWTATLSDVSWSHLEGNVPGTGIGYVFPGKATIKGIREERSGTWKAINNSESATTIKRNYLNLWFDHGANPTGASYSYILLPNKTAQETQAYSNTPQIAILENSAQAQAVREHTLGITGINFWEDKVKTVDKITSNKKSSVMVKETSDQLEVTVSDPTQMNTGVINLEINQAVSGVLLADPRITITQANPTLKMTVNVAGLKGAAVTAVFTPKSSASNNLALMKKVTASSSFYNKDWNIVHAVDGLRDSVDGKKGWSSNDQLTSNHSEWFQVDLGTVSTVSRVDLFPRNDGVTTGQGFPIDFELLTSEDGGNWVTAGAYTDYPFSKNASHSFTFNARPARYVKVVSTRLAQNPYDNNFYRMQFAEIEVY